MDRLFIGYNALLAAAWLAAAVRAWPDAASPTALANAAAHGVALVAPLAARALRARGHPLGTRLAAVYPLMALPWLWGELGSLLPLLHDRANDVLVQAWDLALPGDPVHASWMAHSHAPWLTYSMYASYLSFYVVVGAVPAALLARRDIAPLDDYVFRIMLAYCACGTIYLFFPVIGPTPVYPPHTAIAASAPVRLMRLVEATGDSLGTSFPSSHAVVAVTIALAARRWFSPAVAAALVADCVLMTLAAVYTQNHYGIDVLAGALVAFALATVVRRLAPPEGRGALRRAATPLLPDPRSSA